MNLDYLNRAEGSPIKVLLSCSGHMTSESNVQIENIEADSQGRDVLTFKCPMCGAIHKSLRLG